MSRLTAVLFFFCKNYSVYTGRKTENSIFYGRGRGVMSEGMKEPLPYNGVIVARPAMMSNLKW